MDTEIGSTSKTAFGGHVGQRKAGPVAMETEVTTSIPLKAVPKRPQALKGFRSTLIVTYLLVTMLLTNLSFTILAPFLAQESAKRQVSGAAMGLIFSVNYLICVVACPIFGGMLQAKVVGSSSLMAFGTLAIGVGSILFGLLMPSITTPGPFLFVGLLSRATVGLGSAAVDTAGTSLMVTLAIEAGYKHVGQAIGLVETSMAIGEAVGPIFGGFVYEAGGFRAPFLAAGTLVSFAGPTLLIIMRQSLGNPGGVDADHAPKGGSAWQEQINIYRKTVEVFSNPRMFILVLPTFLGCSSMTWLDATLAPFATSQFNMKPHGVGMAFTVFNVVYAIACPLAGWVAGLVGDVKTLSVGLLSCALSFFMVGPTPLLESLPYGLELATHSGVPLLFIGVALLGVGQGFCFVPALPALFSTYTKISKASADGSEEDLKDMMVGVLNSIHFLGGGIGAPMGASLEEIVGFRWAATFLAVIMLGAMVSMDAMYASELRRQRVRSEAQGRIGTSEIS